MIPHHRQAVAMAGLAPTRARSQQVKDLAARIAAATSAAVDVALVLALLAALAAVAFVKGTGGSGAEDPEEG